MEAISGTPGWNGSLAMAAWSNFTSALSPEHVGLNSSQGGGSHFWVLHNGSAGATQVPARARVRDMALAHAEISVLSLVLALTALGNGFVLWVLLRRRKHNAPMHLFMVNLCVADLVVAFFQVLPQLVWDITETFQGPDVLCRTVKYMQIVGMFASSYMIVAMTVDRHYAICCPLRAYKGGAVSCWNTPIMVAWGLSLVLSIPQVFIFSRSEVAPGVFECWGHFAEHWGLKAYVTWMTLAVFVFPAFIITVCQIRIFREIHDNIYLKSERKVSTDVKKNLVLFHFASLGKQDGREGERRRDVGLPRVTRAEFHERNSNSSPLPSHCKNYNPQHAPKQDCYDFTPQDPTEQCCLSQGCLEQIDACYPSSPHHSETFANAFAPQTDASGPPLHPSSGPPLHPSSGPPLHPSSGPPLHPSSGPPLHPSSGPPLHPSSGPPLHPSSGPPLHPSSGPPLHPSSGPPLHPSSGPPLHPSSGPPLHPSSGPPLHPSSGPPLHTASGPPLHPSSEPALHTSSASSRPLPTPPSGVSKAMSKTVRMTLVIVLVYTVCWSPFFIVQLWAAWDPNPPSQGVAFTILMLLASLNSCTNPWIYTAFSSSVSRELLTLLHCLPHPSRRGSVPDDSSGIHTSTTTKDNPY